MDGSALVDTLQDQQYKILELIPKFIIPNPHIQGTGAENQPPYNSHTIDTLDPTGIFVYLNNCHEFEDSRHKTKTAPQTLGRPLPVAK